MSLPLWSAASVSYLLQSWCTIYSNCKKNSPFLFKLAFVRYFVSTTSADPNHSHFQISCRVRLFLFSSFIREVAFSARCYLFEDCVTYDLICYFRIRVNLNLWDYRSLIGIGKEIYVSTASACISFIKNISFAYNWKYQW